MSIQLNPPTRYSTSSPPSSSSGPSITWLTSTPWTVTHSTLSMWRTARNVRISYTALPPKNPGGRSRLDDLVEYEPVKTDGVRKTVEGVDTQASVENDAVEQQDGCASWDWRGKRWLSFVSSHWEVLGWGEEEMAGGGGVERWAVTWFAPTLFTKEGLDIYCDRREGLSEETYKSLREAFKALGVSKLVAMVDEHMRPVEIRLPWVEG
ncbi:hypothetical protein L249_6135 [Ophiocordyceps polyrhachis-furcata BCC 54312]|uniref:Uncharacterized protein n=1 Tax=Ophiocordyceps polyrhachis-furcata BCC 54312 TaxID=1330021 RepID=A0A367LIN8_9HYPO|nr:hypothetical protein L249_6135 [Ophiocordyceps polyrhachis-furcata BCC 54312]